MLEVIGAGNPEYKGQDWGDVWESSSEAKQLSEEIEQIISSRRNKEDNKNTRDDREYAMPRYVQILAVTKRAFVAYWRSPEYILVSPVPFKWASSYRSNDDQGKILASYIHGAFQYLHILAPWEQLH